MSLLTLISFPAINPQTQTLKQLKSFAFLHTYTIFDKVEGLPPESELSALNSNHFYTELGVNN